MALAVAVESTIIIVKCCKAHEAGLFVLNLHRWQHPIYWWAWGGSRIWFRMARWGGSVPLKLIGRFDYQDF